MKRLFTVTVNGQKYDVSVAEKDASGAAVAQKPQSAAAPAPAPVASKPVAEAPKTEVKSGAGKATIAPMAGKIISLLVKEGDTVKRGQALLVLEAMKLENDIVAPQDGKVEKILVQVGKLVETGEELVVIA